MTRQGRIVLHGIAIVAALIVIGCSSGPAGAGPQTAATPDASRAATGTGIPSSMLSSTLQPLPDDVPVPPGPYVLAADNANGVPSLRIAFTVPADGWDSWGPGVSKDGGGSVGLGFVKVANLYADPCHRSHGRLYPAVGPTVDDLAGALANQPGIQANAPTDVTVDGFAGKYVELRVDPAVDFSSCDDDLFSAGWITPSGDSVPVLGEGQVSQFRVIDVDGVRLVITTWYFPEASAKDRAELEALVDSIQIES